MPGVLRQRLFCHRPPARVCATLSAFCLSTTLIQYPKQLCQTSKVLSQTSSRAFLFYLRKRGRPAGWTPSIYTLIFRRRSILTHLLVFIRIARMQHLGAIDDWS